MQHHGPAPFPLPDTVPGRAAAASARLPPHLSPPRAPEFLIIGLFALRLAKRLIQGIEYYPERDTDIAWLANFLMPFHPQYALAKIAGPRRDDYIANYEGIVSRMITQPRYPIRFMQMNPDHSLQQERREAESERAAEMTDAERLDIIDFCDAAGEWGSVVPIPAREANRMLQLADQRRIADLDESMSLHHGRQVLQDESYPRPDDRQSSRDDRLYFVER